MGVIDFFKRSNFKVLGLEVPFVYYGERGWADLWLVYQDLNKNKQHWIVAEVKPEIVNINETVRQIHRAKAYFFKDKEPLIKGWDNNCMFPLVVEANEQNYKTLLDYEEYFKDIQVVFFDKAAALDNEFNRKLEIHRAVMAQQN